LEGEDDHGLVTSEQAHGHKLRKGLRILHFLVINLYQLLFDDEGLHQDQFTLRQGLDRPR
jgi:hypothetical protein